MRIPRVYFPALPLQPGHEAGLDTDTRHYLVNVLRLSEGRKLIAFNGVDHAQAHATLTQLDRKSASIRIDEVERTERESPLKLRLILGISKPDHMDYGLQKAVELGVSEIVPVQCERSQPPPKGDRLEKRLAHWQGIMISACEQSGRCILPPLHPTQTLSDYFNHASSNQHTCIMLSPYASTTLQAFSDDMIPGVIDLLIGPEGGFSDEEEARADAVGAKKVKFGPRTLRTETAVTAGITALQLMHGDLG